MSNLKNWFKDDYVKSVWEKKYQYNGETLEEFFDRVSGGNEIIKKLMIEKRFIFGGRILANRGTYSKDRKVTMSNCYVLPPIQDSIDSIMQTGSDMAKTYARGGGVGIDISHLRPNGFPVRNSAETTTGAVSFMEYFDMVTKIICQKGRRKH